MISLTALFGMLLAMFAFIGAMRGWAKELLVTSALVLGLFINAILANYIEPYRAALAGQNASTAFLLQGGTLLLMAFFGYQTPRIEALQPKLARERFEEVLLGALMGLLNGYLLFGSIWFYLDSAGYSITDMITAPEGDLAAQVESMMAYMPPNLLPVPQIFFAVGIVFVLIIVVFV